MPLPEGRNRGPLTTFRDCLITAGLKGTGSAAASRDAAPARPFFTLRVIRKGSFRSFNRAGPGRRRRPASDASGNCRWLAHDVRNETDEHVRPFRPFHRRLPSCGDCHFTRAGLSGRNRPEFPTECYGSYVTNHQIVKEPWPLRLAHARKRGHWPGGRSLVWPGGGTVEMADGPVPRPAREGRWHSCFRRNAQASYRALPLVGGTATSSPGGLTGLSRSAAFPNKYQSCPLNPRGEPAWSGPFLDCGDGGRRGLLGKINCLRPGFPRWSLERR